MFDIRYEFKVINGERFLTLAASEFEKFAPASSKVTATDTHTFDALVAFFDLEGFTSFCNRPDPYLFVERFLGEFEGWIFAELRTSFVRPAIFPDSKEFFLWDHLPVFWKPTGDGGFFVWDLHRPDFIGDKSVGNIVIRCQTIVHRYTSEFLPTIRQDVSAPPPKLRCGIARGGVIPIRMGADYVGACINCAARLQKLKTLPFAILRNGIDPKKCFDDKHQKFFITKRIKLRGLQHDENVMIDKNDWDTLAMTDQREIPDP